MTSKKLSIEEKINAVRKLLGHKEILVEVFSNKRKTEILKITNLDLLELEDNINTEKQNDEDNLIKTHSYIG